MFRVGSSCVVGLAGALVLCGHASAGAQPTAPVAMTSAPVDATTPAPPYVVGVGDSLLVWVWKNPELTVEVPVRPDGKVTLPLVNDIQAQGRTSTEIAAAMRARLATFVRDPFVSVLVKSFAPATNDSAIHVLGAAAAPKTVPYRAGITALDVIIESGGLNIYANGDGARLIRREGAEYRSYPLRLRRLIKAADLSANVDLMPGDTIRIPERWF